MKKKGYIILVSVVILGVIFGIVSCIIDRNKGKEFKKHVIEDYNFEISYPDAYIDISKSGEDTSKILSNLSVKESGEELSEYMQNLNFVETVKNLKNNLNGIRMIVEAIYVEKTELTLEEICNRYIVMFKVYNEDAKLKNSTKEIVSLDGRDAGKVTINVKGEIEDSIVIAYLIYRSLTILVDSIKNFSTKEESTLL